MFVIISKHPAFGKLYVGRQRPVASKAAAVKFSTREMAQDRIDFWLDFFNPDDRDPKFFNNMEVIEA